MPAPTTPNHNHIECYRLAVCKRDASLARATAALQVKIAGTNFLLAGVSEAGQQGQ
jgi:hypothetical protein